MPTPSIDWLRAHIDINSRRCLRAVWVAGTLLAGVPHTETGAVAQEVKPPDADVHLRLSLTIGSDFGAEEYTFASVWEIAVSQKGDIYVLDMLDKLVKVYDRQGMFLTAFGGEGEGPGEFIRPVELYVDTLVRVLDSALHRVSSFTLRGEHRETRRLPSFSLNINGASGLRIARAFRLKSGDVLGITRSSYAWGQPFHDPYIALVLLNPDSGIIDTITVYHSGGTLWHSDTGAFGITGPRFGPGGAWALYGDSLLAVADGYSGNVRWYRADQEGFHLSRVANLALDSRAVTAADIREVKEEFDKVSEDPRFQPYRSFV